MLFLLSKAKPPTYYCRPKSCNRVREYVKPLSLASIAAGADGLMIETHPHPSTALSDGPQSLTFDQFEEIIEELKPIVSAVGREF